MADENKLRHTPHKLYFFFQVIANHGARNGLYQLCNGMCQVLHIECSNLQLSAATMVAARLCWYSCLFPLAFESGLFMSDYL